MAGGTLHPIDPMDRYHTFWLRFAATVIDGAVVGPVGMVSVLAAGYGSEAVAIALALVVAPAGWAYTSYCHGRWGMTVGKRAVGIAVVRADSGGPIGYRRAILRDVGTVAFSLLAALILIGEVRDGDVEHYRLFDFDRLQVEQQAGEAPSFDEATRPLRETWSPARLLQVLLGSCWSFAELITMLSNERRRAIHDFIGGTVVVKVASRLPMPQPP